jgi:hypothetical protein
MSGTKRAPPLIDFQNIAERMQPLADFYLKYKPEQKTMRVFPEDLRIVKTWPQFSERFGFEVTERQASFRGFKLVATLRDQE